MPQVQGAFTSTREPPAYEASAMEGKASSCTEHTEHAPGVGRVFSPLDEGIGATFRLSGTAKTASMRSIWQLGCRLPGLHGCLTT